MGPVQTQLFNQNRTALTVSRASSQFVSSLMVRERDFKKSAGNHQANLENTLKSIFPDRKEENTLEHARRILGDSVLDLSSDDLKNRLTEFQYLLDCWLDNFEKGIFNNKTLEQLLREG